MSLTESNTGRNLLRLLRSANEQSVVLGLEIHKSNPTPESTQMLAAYHKLYEELFKVNIEVLSPEHIVKFNGSHLLIRGKLRQFQKEIGQLRQLQALYMEFIQITELLPVYHLKLVNSSSYNT